MGLVRYGWLLFFFPLIINGQDYYEDPGDKYPKYCQECLQTLDNLPATIEYGLTGRGDSVFFVTNDIEWLFESLLTSSKDGLMVDVVSKELYKCGDKVGYSQRSLHRGILLPPVFKDDLEDRVVFKDNGYFYIFLGSTLGIELKSQNLEYNLIILQKGYHCYYNTFYDLPPPSWRLPLSFFRVQEDTVFLTEKYKWIGKDTIRFTVPFDKAETQINKVALNKLLFNLNLFENNIDSVVIYGFASIEGSEERNKILQENRAKSVAGYIRGYSENRFPLEIMTEENWAQFYRDIGKSPWAYLVNKPKSEIRSFVNANSGTLEQILKNHRATVVDLYLSPRESEINTYSTIPQDFFKYPPTPSKIDGLLKYIKKKEISIENLLGKVFNEANEPYKWLNEIVLTEHFNDNMTVKEAWWYIERSGNYGDLPNWLKYNSLNLSCKLLFHENDFSTIEEKKYFARLEDVPDSLIDQAYYKIRLNKFLLMAERAKKQKDYKELDLILQVLDMTLRKTELTPKETQQTARFLEYFGFSSMAIDILSEYAYQQGVYSGLVSDYIAFTITKDVFLRSPAYRELLKRFSQREKVLYCKLFNSYQAGGISFQLLEERYLRDLYCSTCVTETSENQEKIN
ncbi:OmpA family protein [Marinigracilibium pacificum]|uniref:OmpA family protein n=1 Tax=Marinigracilibium pacificum TaxID=2729599 RepID=A0A848ITZ7_9BACT|nr:hypothetical protein [Marinigracilibium pacificum]NMM46775.1 hypothetical protein [Marinigracilibium pacificum]